MTAKVTFDLLPCGHYFRLPHHSQYANEANPDQALSLPPAPDTVTCSNVHFRQVFRARARRGTGKHSHLQRCAYELWDGTDASDTTQSFLFEGFCF